MRCATAKQLMYLTRSGELDDASRRKLQEHLRTCERCSAEHAAVDRTTAVVDSVRHAAPRLDDPAGLTHAIMRQVDAERMRGAARPSFPAFASLSLHRFRAVCSAAAFVIVAVFFLQSLVDARRIESLEARMGRAAQRAGSQASVSYDDIRSAAGKAESLNGLSERQAAAVASEVGSLFLVIRTSPLGSTPEMERLRAKYPRLWTLTLDRGLDAQTRKILATEGKAFLKDVQELIDLGGQ